MVPFWVVQPNLVSFLETQTIAVNVIWYFHFVTCYLQPHPGIHFWQLLSNCEDYFCGSWNWILGELNIKSLEWGISHPNTSFGGVTPVTNSGIDWSQSVWLSSTTFDRYCSSVLLNVSTIPLNWGWRGVVPVSYTHLDVYKRQDFISKTGIILDIHDKKF